MLFNKVIHFGRNNLHIKYTMKGTELSVTQYERNPELDVSSDLKVFSQCQQAYSKANRMLGLISRNIYNKSRTVMFQLYMTDSGSTSCGVLHSGLESLLQERQGAD